MVRGASGSGTSQNAARNQSAQPGSGLNGGLGASDGNTAMGAGPASTQGAASDGSTNRTSNSAVGQRR